jgi:Pseudouridylate synthases, 23S RNA-specific
MFSVEEEQNGKRVDQFITEQLPSFSRTKIGKLVKEGALLINNKPINENAKKIVTGDQIQLEVPEPIVTDTVAQDIKLNIIFEDKDLLVVNKPIGMVVHPGAGI